MNMNFNGEYAANQLFLADIDDVDHEDADACQLLWRAVLTEALIDALWIWGSQVRVATIPARNWFYTDDFIETCNNALIDASRVHAEFERRVTLSDSGDYVAALDGLLSDVLVTTAMKRTGQTQIGGG